MAAMIRSVVLLWALSSSFAFIPSSTKTCPPGRLVGLAMEAVSKQQDEVASAAIFANLPKIVAAGMLAFSTAFGPLPSLDTSNHHPMIPMANAIESKVIGELKGSGLVFKDSLIIESFEDPKVKGVTLYLSNFQRPLTDRLQKDFFSDPSSAGIGCAKTGPVQFASSIAVGSGGEEVFEESKSLLFKSLRVQRVYDKEHNTIVYVAFNTRLNKGDDSNNSRFKSALCAVNLDESDTAAAPSAAKAAAVVAK